MTELYCIDKKGKIRVFSLYVNGTSIITSTGTLNGNLITKSRKVTSGKQGRDMLEQAGFEGTSLINEKLDEGYKSIKQLFDRHSSLYPDFMIPGYDNHTNEHRVILLFDLLNIKFNTNKYWSSLPMLAEKWKDFKKKVKYPALGQPKLNGVRCLASWNKEENKVALMSRGGQKYIMPHIELALTSFLSQNPHIQFDGELYKAGMPLQDIVGRVKVENPEEFNRKLIIEYHIYDLAVEDVQQEPRLILVRRLIDQINSKDIIPVLHDYISNEQQVMEYHNSYVAQGYEGGMIRDPLAYYQFGFRDSCLIKVKEFIDEEFEIVGCDVDSDKGIESFVFVLQNNQGKMLGGDYKSKNIFKARPTGTLEAKQIWYNNISKFLGKKATVRFQERTKDGLPHQANLRAEKTDLLIEAIRDYD